MSQDITAEVCVIGAGIAGVTTACLLAREDRHVVLIDDGPVGGGMTGRTTAHLVNALDERYSEVEKMLGEECSHLYAQSHTAAIDRVEQIVTAHKIECDFERLDGYLFLAPGEKEEVLDRELAAAQRAGLVEVEKLAGAPPSSYRTGPCLRFPDQGQDS